MMGWLFLAREVEMGVARFGSGNGSLTVLFRKHNGSHCGVNLYEMKRK